MSAGPVGITARVTSDGSGRRLGFAARGRKLLVFMAFGALWPAAWITSAWTGSLAAERMGYGQWSVHLEELLPYAMIEFPTNLLLGFAASLVVGAVLCVAARRMSAYFVAALIGGIVSGFWSARVDHAPWRSIDIVELLRDPKEVAGWDVLGLRLEDGRTVPLPGVDALPQSSAMLAALIASGVEIDPTGRVYGLLPIHHWCGNDPIHHHVARLDIARVLAFVGDVGSMTTRSAPGQRERCADVGLNGWDVWCYYLFARDEGVLPNEMMSDW